MQNDEPKTRFLSPLALDLILVSALSLFVELLIVRWLSADLRAFTVFRTLPLITCFVGLGVGIALRNDRSFKYAPIALLLTAGVIKTADLTGVAFWGFPSLSSYQWQNLVGMAPNAPPAAAFLIAFMLLVILFLAGPFGVCVAIGSRLGVLFTKFAPLAAYSYNLLGALIGGILFPILSFMEFDPLQLCAASAVILAALLFWRRNTHWSVIPSVVALPLILLLLPTAGAMPLDPAFAAIKNKEFKTLWSPYQRIDLCLFKRSPDKSADADNVFGLELSTNRAFYQYYLDKSKAEQLSPTIRSRIDHNKKIYDLAFRLNQPKSVLIVGSGTGQDVASAVEAGAERIDAVEIDPVIQKIGIKYNRHLSDPTVHLFLDDARHYFETTKEKYDVIDFATLDSQVVSGLGSSVRVDAYIYTEESIRQALRLLKPGGLLVITFVTPAEWSEHRLFETFRRAAGYDPLVVDNVRTFILGDAVREKRLIVPGVNVVIQNLPPSVRGLTDDWPYLYVRTDVIDYPYLLVVGEILLLGAFAGRKFLKAQDATAWQMFFLGAAFVILELHAISSLCLVFGSTWITSAIVINGILTMIFLANLLVIRFAKLLVSNQPVAYLILFLSILLSFFLPVTQMLASESVSREVLQTTVLVVRILPMGVAAIIFSEALSTASDVPRAFAFNLFGAVIGGLLEYISTFTGIRSLLIVAAFLYLTSMIFHLKGRKHQKSALVADAD